MNWAFNAVTASLEIRFKKPAPLLEPLSVYGEITEVKGRTHQGQGHVTKEDGTVLATGTSTLMRQSDFLIGMHGNSWIPTQLVLRIQISNIFEMSLHNISVPSVGGDEAERDQTVFLLGSTPTRTLPHRRTGFRVNRGRQFQIFFVRTVFGKRNALMPEAEKPVSSGNK